MQKVYNWEVQEHPYEPFVPGEAKALILGSAPPWRFCEPKPKPLGDLDVDFYYGSYNRGYNLLWEVLFRVFEPASLEKLGHVRHLQTPRQERTFRKSRFLKEFLENHSLGMADILLVFSRRDRSAADSKLKPSEFTDILGVIGKHEGIGSIYCTSLHNVFLWLQGYLASMGISMEPDPEGTWFFTLPAITGSDLSGRRIYVHVLPSPSPVGRLRFPNHKAFVDHLTAAYERIFKALRESASEI